MAAAAAATDPGIRAAAAAAAAASVGWPPQPHRYDPALHDKYLDGDMQRLATLVADKLAGLPDRKQRRVAFEKYVTHCLAGGRYGDAAEDAERAAAERLEDPFDTVALTLPRAAEDTPEALLARRDALWRDVRASRSAAAEMDDKALLRALSAEDDPRFGQLLDLTENANDVVRMAAAPTCAGWPRGAWASVCEGALLGPFATRDEARVHIRAVPRSCFGAVSWQVGVPLVPLMIG